MAGSKDPYGFNAAWKKGASHAGTGGAAPLQFVGGPMPMQPEQEGPSVPPGRVPTGAGAPRGPGEEPPLLEELGVDPAQMRKKAVSMVKPGKPERAAVVTEEGDLSGPLLVATAMAVMHLLSGKVTFGHVYAWLGIFLLGMHWLIGQVAGQGSRVEFYRCSSLIGYSLIPVVVASGLALPLPLRAKVPLLAFGVLWSTRGCSKLLIAASPALTDCRLVVAYPCALAYSLFALLSL